MKREYLLTDEEKQKRKQRSQNNQSAMQLNGNILDEIDQVNSPLRSLTDRSHEDLCLSSADDGSGQRRTKQ